MVETHLDHLSSMNSPRRANAVEGEQVLDQVQAELSRLRAGVLEILQSFDGVDACVFWACPGPNNPIAHMATCVVCAAQIQLRQLLGDGP